MKPVDRRKLFTALRRSCRTRGLEFVEDPDSGGGSHGSLVFHGAAGISPLRLVIAYAREISPGVQRGMLRYAAQQAETRSSAEDRALAGAVADLLRECLR